MGIFARRAISVVVRKKMANDFRFRKIPPAALAAATAVIKDYNERSPRAIKRRRPRN